MQFFKKKNHRAFNIYCTTGIHILKVNAYVHKDNSVLKKPYSVCDLHSVITRPARITQLGNEEVHVNFYMHIR